MRGSIGESRCTRYTILQSYSVCMEYGVLYYLYPVQVLSLCTQPRLVGSPKHSVQGIHYVTSINNYPDTRTRGPDSSLEQPLQLCPNKLNEAFLNYRTLVSYPNHQPIMAVNCTLTVRDKSYSVRSWRRDTFQRTAWPVPLQATCRQLVESLLTLRESSTLQIPCLSLDSKGRVWCGEHSWPVFRSTRPKPQRIHGQDWRQSTVMDGR